MEEKELLSVIVPVYNVDKRIERCLLSITNQSYKNIEIIVIDDGSTDRSGLICDKLAEKDHRIQVIHNEVNLGVSKARNMGTTLARGFYITFVDADDYIESMMYEVLIQDIEYYDTDIAMCGVYEKNRQYSKLINNKNEINLYTGQELLEKIYKKDYVMYIVMWNKVYKSKVFNGVVFPDGVTREDEFVMHEIMYNAKYISVRNKEFYHYTTHEGSITKQKDINRLDRLKAVEMRMKFFEEKGLLDLYYLSLLRLLNDSVRSFYYALYYLKADIEAKEVKDRFALYYNVTKMMINYFKKKKIHPRYLHIKLGLIHFFALTVK